MFFYKKNMYKVLGVTFFGGKDAVLFRIPQSIATPQGEARAHSPYLYCIHPPYSRQDDGHGLLILYFL